MEKEQKLEANKKRHRESTESARASRTQRSTEILHPIPSLKRHDQKLESGLIDGDQGHGLLLQHQGPKRVRPVGVKLVRPSILLRACFLLDISHIPHTTWPMFNLMILYLRLLIRVFASYCANGRLGFSLSPGVYLYRLGPWPSLPYPFTPSATQIRPGWIQVRSHHKDFAI